MRAVMLREYGGVDRLAEVSDAPAPVPGETEVLIAVRACGVCFFDVISRQGLRSKTKMPIVLGHEIAGEIVQAGKNVTAFKVGDRVVCAGGVRCGECDSCVGERESQCERSVGIGTSIDGGYAEYVKLPANCLCRIPDSVSYDDASIASCAIQTPYSAIVRKAKVQPGETVLITGASGGVGIHAVQIAKMVGGQVLAVTTSPEKVASIKSAGADLVIVDREGKFHEHVKEHTGAKGVDVVIENVGSKTFESSFRSLGRGGRLVFVGELTGDRVSFNPAWAIYKELILSGALCANRGELKTVLGLMESGRIKAAIFRKFGLHQVGQSHAIMESRGAVGRMVIMPALTA